MKFSFTFLGVCVLLAMAVAEEGNVDKKQADAKPEETEPAETKTDTKPATNDKPVTEDKPDTGNKTEPNGTPSNDQPAADVCANFEGERNLKSANSGNGILGAWHCMTYTHCKDKKSETKHCIGWPLVPLKQYSPSAQKCEWFWNVRCGEDDAKK